MSGQCPVVGNWMQKFESPTTRFEAAEKNTTDVPAPSIEGSVLASLPCEPSEATLTLTVVLAFTSRTNTSGHWPGPGKEGWQVFVSSAIRFVATESKAILSPRS